MGVIVLDYAKIGERIRERRRELKLTQSQLAEMIDISLTHMNHIETGSTKLSLQVFADIAVALRVRADELLFDARPERDISVTRMAELMKRCSLKDAHIITDAAYAIKNAMDKYR